MHSPDAALFAMPPKTHATKSEFAEIAGVSKGRVSQMIKEGLPVEHNGTIDIARGRIWIQDNIDSSRRKAETGTINTRDRLNAIKLEREEIELARLKGEIADRNGVERAIFARARAERDAWQQWPRRISAELAGRLACEESLVLAVITDEVRKELDRRADRSTEVLAMEASDD
jgi:hypothetical protein